MTKASGGDRIQVELFKIVQDDAVKVLCSMCQQIWKIEQWLQDWKRSIFIPIPKKHNAKESLNFCTVALISQRKVMPKFLQVRGFSSMWTENFQMYKLGFEEAEEPEIKLPTFVGSWRKQGNSRKTSTSASLTVLKPLIVWITTNWKILKRDENTRLPYLSPEKPVCGSRSNS